MLSSACNKEDDEQIISSETVNSDIPNTFTDSRDSAIYKTIVIGDQTWMAENLRYLPNVVGSDSGSITEALYYVYGYEGTQVSGAKANNNYQTYGVLYNWSAATFGPPSRSETPLNVKGICPDGWHLPSDIEWTKLTDFLGGRSLAGGKLKESGTVHWASPNAKATNETNFTALPSGFRTSDGNFTDVGLNGFWWSSTENSAINAWFRNMYYENGDVYRIDFFKDVGFCVRCIEDI